MGVCLLSIVKCAFYVILLAFLFVVAADLQTWMESREEDPRRETPIREAQLKRDSICATPDRYQKLNMDLYRYIFLLIIFRGWGWGIGFPWISVIEPYRVDVHAP